MSPPTPSPPAPQAFFQVLKLHQLISESLETTLRDLGMTPSQYTAMSLVRHHEPVTPAELSRKLGITAQSAWETVRSLEALGYLVRVPIPNNKRSISLYLTPSGRSELEKADLLVLDAEKSFFAKLKSKDYAKFLESMHTLRGVTGRAT